MARAVDEQLVEILANRQSVGDICDGRIYHLEVYKANSSLTRFPCLVYYRNNRERELELTGVADGYHTEFTVVVVSLLSSDLRTISNDIEQLNELDQNEALQTASENILWLTVETDIEGIEFEIEQQEKGFKSTSISVLIAHETEEEP